MNDYANGYLPTSFQGVYTLNRDIHEAHETRQINMYHIPRSKSRFVDKLPQFQFPKLWNDWHGKLGSNLTRNELKRSIRTICLADYASVVNCDNPHCYDCGNRL